MTEPPRPEDPVALTDLEVVQRFSLAVRTATADRAELARILRADLEWLQDTAPTGRSAPRRAASTRSRVPKKA
ncbi:MAG: hypothetical protein ACYDB7_05805 [Mycobacteriales bacterium]